jgi:flagellar motility protein MotE (MotC chaperone)
MRFSLPSKAVSMPRLLPATIAVMVVLLAVKSGQLIFPAIAETSAPHTKPLTPASPAGPAAHGTSPKAEHPVPSEALPKSEPLSAASTPLLTLPSEPPITPSERALLTDLRQRRIALDAREAAIASREITFQALEKKLALRVDELSHLQTRLEDLERQRKERDDQNWRGLVKLYEAMKPRDAATIFNELDPAVLIPVLDRMKEAKAALIMSAMLPDRARQVTIELATERKKANSVENSTVGNPANAASRAGG